MSFTRLTLTHSVTGEVFTFARFELPEHLPFGGEQALVVHRLVGGVRHIDALGPNPEPLTWSGFFVGNNGLSRALYLDGIRKAGVTVTVAWSELSFQAVIKRLTYDFLMPYRIAYQITLEVVRDLTAPVSVMASPSLDQLVFDDMSACQALVDSLGIPELSDAFNGLVDTVNTINDFSTAVTSEVKGVLYEIHGVQMCVNNLLSSATLSIQQLSTLGGVLPGNTLTRNVQNFANQTSAVTQTVALVALNKTLGRLALNLGQIATSGKVVTLAGSDLYTLAAQSYGDAMGWASIAQANGLTDPLISDVTDVIIPKAGVTGGVLRG